MKLPFENESFHAVVNDQVLEHVEGDPEGVTVTETIFDTNEKIIKTSSSFSKDSIIKE